MSDYQCYNYKLGVRIEAVVFAIKNEMLSTI